MKNNLKECGLYHGCKIYIETDDEVIYQLFLKNHSAAMMAHYGIRKTDEELEEDIDELLASQKIVSNTNK